MRVKAAAKIKEIKLDYVSQLRRAKPKSQEQALAEKRVAAQREKQRQFLAQRRLACFSAAPRHDVLNVRQLGLTQGKETMARPNTSVPSPAAEVEIEPRPTSQKGLSAGSKSAQRADRMHVSFQNMHIEESIKAKPTKAKLSKTTGLSKASRDESLIQEELGLIDDIVRSRAASRLGERDNCIDDIERKVFLLRRATTALRNKNGGSVISSKSKYKKQKEHTELVQMCSTTPSTRAGSKCQILLNRG